MKVQGFQTQMKKELARAHGSTSLDTHLSEFPIFTRSTLHNVSEFKCLLHVVVIFD